MLVQRSEGGPLAAAREWSSALGWFDPEDFGGKMRVLSATTCKRLRQLHERLHGIKVADCFLTDCPIERKALEQALDGNLEFLPIQGVRNLGHGEYFIRNVPWR